MFGNDPILVHDILGQVYAFTRWRRPISDELSERDVFGEDRTYAKQTLRSIATYQQHDPFNYRLYDVWQMVFKKPWTRPATLNDLINDLAEAAHNGRLFAYLESSWLDRAPATSSGLGGGAADGGGGSDEVADEPRTQARSSNSNGPGQAFLALIPPPPVAPAPVATVPAQLTFMQRAAAGLTTFTKVLRTASPWSLLAYSGGLGGSLDEVVADDGTVYRKYSSELIYNAVGPDGSQWQTASPQEDMEYRTWLANGGDGSFQTWLSSGKPTEQGTLLSYQNKPTLDDAINGLRNSNGPEAERFARDIAEMSTHVSQNADRVVLGRWEENGGYIGEAKANGGVWYETDPSFFPKLTDGLSEAEGRQKAWLVNEQFLHRQLESGVGRIELHGENITEVLINRPNSFTAMEIKYLEKNSNNFGYMRDGNFWIKVD